MLIGGEDLFGAILFLALIFPANKQSDCLLFSKMDHEKSVLIKILRFGSQNPMHILLGNLCVVVGFESFGHVLPVLERPVLPLADNQICTYIADLIEADLQLILA